MNPTRSLAAPLHALAHVLAFMRALFGGYLARLRAQRRARAYPADWRIHHAGLAELEWDVAWIVSQGGRMLLEHGVLDVWAIPSADPPTGWTTPMPASAEAMARRMEIVTRVLGDIECYIHARAQRIALDTLAALHHGADASARALAPTRAPEFSEAPRLFAPNASARAPPELRAACENRL